MRERAICAQAQWGGAADQYFGVFGIGSNGSMYCKFLGTSNGHWLPSQTDWLSLGGEFESYPAAARGPQSFIWSTNAFGVGLDNQAFMLNLEPTGSRPPFGLPVPGNWQPIGGTFNGPIMATAFGYSPGHFMDNTALVGLGTDNQPIILATDSYDLTSGKVPGWVGLGGILITEMAIANFSTNDPAANTFELFGVGTDAQMYRLEVDGSQSPPKSGGWQPAGGCFISAPSVTKWSTTRTDVFGIGFDKQMYHRAFENGGWIEDWEPLGGAFDSPPATVAWGNNRLDLFGIGIDGGMYHKYWAGGPWMPSPTHWDLIGGEFTSAPTVITLDTEQLDIFGLGTDSQMYHKAWRGGPDWSPPQLGWESIGAPPGGFKIPQQAQVQKPSQLDFDWPIAIPGGTPVGGSLHVTLFKDGTSKFSGHLHDSGFPSYACSVACAVIDGRNRAYTFQVAGDVWGTDLPGSRDLDWNVTTQPNSSLRDNWSDMFPCGGAKFGARIDTQTMPPGGLIINVATVLKDLAGEVPLTVIPLVGRAQ